MNPKNFNLSDLAMLLLSATDNLLVLHNVLGEKYGNDPACEGVYAVWANLRWVAEEMIDQIDRLPEGMLEQTMRK